MKSYLPQIHSILLDSYRILYTGLKSFIERTVTRIIQRIQDYKYQDLISDLIETS